MENDQHTKNVAPENDSPGLKALVAVATGLGVIGFVTLIGGAITHVQLAAVGIPADQVVSALPQSTLLVVGVRQLVGFFGSVVLVLAMLWLLESKGVSRGRVRWVGVVLIAVVGMVVIEVDLVNAQRALLYEALTIVLVPLLVVMIWFAGIKGMPRFSIFATVTAIAAALVLSAWRYTLSRLSPVVRPVVVVRTTGSSIAGIYAAANSSEVEVGEVCQQSAGSNRGSGRSGIVLVIPRNDIRTMLVGSGGLLPDVLARERSLVSSVVTTTSPGGPVSEPNGAKCTDALAAQLQEHSR
jgi:hypothetical protein